MSAVRWVPGAAARQSDACTLEVGEPTQSFEGYVEGERTGVEHALCSWDFFITDAAPILIHHSSLLIKNTACVVEQA